MNTKPYLARHKVLVGVAGALLAAAGLVWAVAGEKAPEHVRARPQAQAGAADTREPVPEPAPQGTALLRQFSRAFQQAAGRVNPSVVAIYSEQLARPTSMTSSPFLDDPFLRQFFGNGRGVPQVPHKTEGMGSGVIITEDGTILTNNHVVRDASKVTVELDGRKYPARVIGTDPQTDLAVVKIDATGLQAAELGDSDGLQVGEWVIAVGNPLELTHSVTAGIVSATGRSDVGVAAYENFIQTDASINPGNSGGALADLDGKVVGINTAIATPTGGNIGIGFAIPINMARQVMDDLVQRGRISRGYLALVPQDLDEDLAKAMDLGDQRGVLVAEVTRDGPAAKAGLRRGDVILAFNEHKVDSATQLRNAVAGVKPGSEVQVEGLRDGRRRTFRVVLSERPDSVAAATPERDDDEGKESGGRLGLSLQPLTPDVAGQLGYGSDVQGVLVSSVEPGSPAAEAGLAPGDLIEAVGRTEVRSVDELRRALAARSGDVALLVRRGERSQYVAISRS